MVKRAQPPEPLSRKQHSRREKSAHRRWLIIGTAIVLGVSAALLGWGLRKSMWSSPAALWPSSTATRSLDDYQRLAIPPACLSEQLNQAQAQLDATDATDETMSFMRQIYEQQVQYYQNQLMGVGANTLEEMITDRVIRQEAARRGITVTDEEVQLEIEQQFDYHRTPPTPAPTSEPTPTATSPAVAEIALESTATPAPTLTPLPTPTPVTLESFEQSWKGYLETIQRLSGFTEDDYRGQVASQLYRERARGHRSRDAGRGRAGLGAPHSGGHGGRSAGRHRAAGRRRGLCHAGPRAVVDTGSGAQGGDLGWFTYGRMVPEFSAAAFSLTPGEVSEPVKSDYGYHIIKVEAHEQDRPVDEADMAAVRREHFDAWLELQEGEGVERPWTSDMVPVAQGYGG